MSPKTYYEWFTEFIVGKREVPVSETHDRFAAHSTRRFIDQAGDIWEIASTYTGRLIVRKGEVGNDGVTIQWQDWVTEHDVEMPKLHGPCELSGMARLLACTTDAYGKQFPLTRRP